MEISRCALLFDCERTDIGKRPQKDHEGIQLSLPHKCDSISSPFYCISPVATDLTAGAAEGNRAALGLIFIVVLT